MERIILDEGEIQRLGGLVEPTELCDEDGRVIGYLTPVEDDTVTAYGPNGENDD